MRAVVKLTTVGAGHEIVTGVFRVCAVHMSGYRMESGEVVSMETVVVLQPAEGRGADGQVWPCLGLHYLCANVVNMDIVSCWRELFVLVMLIEASKSLSYKVHHPLSFTFVVVAVARKVFVAGLKLLLFSQVCFIQLPQSLKTCKLSFWQNLVHKGKHVPNPIQTNGWRLDVFSFKEALSNIIMVLM